MSRSDDERFRAPTTPTTGDDAPGAGEPGALFRLLRHGQSYWLDNLSRAMIRNGELERRVREEGLRGVTSNPAIFAKAISAGAEYDDGIRTLAQSGQGLEEIYEELAVDDVRDACDVLRPVYESSEGADGFVSLEVSPHLAHDTGGSIREALRLFDSVDRPNVLIKIPGTPAGVPAIEEALYRGVNVNVTLLFSVASYEAVARAYLRALERRSAEGKPVDDVASVASFFLSRIDVLLDEVLGQRIRPEGPAPDREGPPRPQALLGKAAVANAKLAYRSFRRLFSGERWTALAEAGARPQRMLWASTSTKDPLYRDVRYVEPLIGPHTVNTMPERTIEAFEDHGAVATTVEEGTGEAETTMARIGEAGIDFDRITSQLLDEGVAKFVAPYDRLMGVLDEKRRALTGPWPSRERLRSGDLGPVLEDTLDSLQARKVPRRLAAGDEGLWADPGVEPGVTAGIRNRLGWLDAPEEFAGRIPELIEWADGIRHEGVRHVLLLGMGGSSLAAETIGRAFGPDRDGPTLSVLDDTHPEAIERAERELDLSRTLVVVASKSGRTVETLRLYRHFWRRIRNELGTGPGDRFVAVTDPGSPLAREAVDRGFRKIFENPEDVGGRWSALTWFGLVPAALAGADAAGLMARAREMRRACDPALPAPAHPGVRLGAWLGIAARKGRDKITLYVDDGIAGLRDWLEQLLAESLGKEGTGVIPVSGELPSAPAAVGDDRVFVHLRRPDVEDQGVGELFDRLEAEGHPTARIEVPGPADLGAEFYRWEVAVATAGIVLGVNPFDEPDVSSTKEEVDTLLARIRETGTLPGEPPVLEEGGAVVRGETGWIVPGSGGLLERAVRSAAPGEYLALLPYFPLVEGRRRALETLRRRAWTVSGVPVTVGAGPRYLHSTGQLHKGGPNTGLFLILTAGPGPLPGRPAGGSGGADERTDRRGEAAVGEVDLATLNRVQAFADYRSLRSRDRRVLWVHLEGSPEEGLRRLLDQVHAGAPAGAAGARGGG